MKSKRTVNEYTYMYTSLDLLLYSFTVNHLHVYTHSYLCALISIIHGQCQGSLAPLLTVTCFPSPIQVSKKMQVYYSKSGKNFTGQEYISYMELL